jgi:hypothetical protein
MFFELRNALHMVLAADMTVLAAKVAHHMSILDLLLLMFLLQYNLQLVPE